MDHIWIPTRPNRPLPKFAVKGGYEADGSPIYVGRCSHKGDMMPAKVVPSKGCAYVAWGSEVHAQHEYELLIGPGYGWVPENDGNVPMNAVSSGDTSDGEHLYVGRGLYEGSLVVGKIQPSHQCLYIPYGNEEIKLDDYEVLILKYSDTWHPTSLENTPARTVLAGEDSDGSPIYVARALHNGLMVPAKFIPSRGEAYIASDGMEIETTEIEVLIGSHYKWVKPHYQDMPPNAVFTGHTSDGMPLFVGRGHYKGSLTPGLVSLEENCLLIPFGKREVRVPHYDVLTKP